MDYEAILAELRDKRAMLDTAIAAIEGLRGGATPAPPSAPATPVVRQKAPRAARKESSRGRPTSASQDRREAILATLADGSPTTLATIAERLRISREDVRYQIQRLSREGLVVGEGRTSNRVWRRA